MMFAVIACAVGFDDAHPYAAPVAATQADAVDNWLNAALTNGESEHECRRAAEHLKSNDLDTLVEIYDGDERLVVVQLS